MRELSLSNCRIDRRFEVRQALGKGSYAEIYVASDALASPQSPHKQVVIKALNVFLQDDLDRDLERTLVENFQNEALALDRVRHPNIISRLGHGTARDLAGTVFHYLVLEYLSGGDLQNAVRKRALPIDAVFRYVEQICAGLGHAHRNGVIHRDIKPQNLLLTGDLATVKIADFGVARFTLADSPITRVGTNIYAPPEHSPLSSGTYEPSDLTPAADVYSLAKTLYTLVTREAPRQYSGRPITDLPEEFRYESWAGALITVLRHATADLPSSRPQSVDAFWEELNAVSLLLDGVEPETVLRRRDSLPQAHVSRGYTPIIPAQPVFEIELPRSQPLYQAPVKEAAPIYSPLAPKGSVHAQAVRGSSGTATPAPKKKNFLRVLAVFIILAASFVGLLFGTAQYMRTKGILPSVGLPGSSYKTGVATTDVFLRAGPSADNPKVGLVTKDSKVRVVNTQNNWYQVEVIQQGRERSGSDQQTKGWLNGKYLDMDGN